MNTVSSEADGSGKMFNGIAARYDLLNRINSLGLDKSWRKAAVKALRLEAQPRVIDLATGTADVPLEIIRQHPDATVIGLDPSVGMLKYGQEKIEGANLQDKVELIEGDAQRLAYPNNSFDGVSIAFGIRNVPDRLQALKEIARVLRPGGRMVILELSEPKNGLMAALARIHVQLFVPMVGALLSGKAEYSYLRTSIEAFPRPEVFEDMIREAGLVPIERRNFAFGACVLYVASAQKGD